MGAGIDRCSRSRASTAKSREASEPAARERSRHRRDRRHGARRHRHRAEHIQIGTRSRRVDRSRTAPELDRRQGTEATSPKVVCLCGSTRFWREFQRAGLDETMKGNIVLSIGAASGTDDEHFGNLPQEEYDRVKTMLDELHLRKIEMADEVLILDVGGYIGESTGRELMHAVKLGKEIRFLEPIAPRPDWSWMRALPEPCPALAEGHSWGLWAYLDEGWILTVAEVDEDGDDVGERHYDVEWPFPVNYARVKDFAALGFEIL